jgi:hypothetical protein
MPKYDPNDDTSIREIFDRDGEYLRREGYQFPVDLKENADDTLPRQTAQQGLSALALEAAQKWEETGSDELF